ncbi:MAG: hypothetical protein GF333_04685 [Candidatus Omnitrophica bacterium]|nr:hypothetical protein [Candidatus Omnitrophota bacterium]
MKDTEGRRKGKKWVVLLAVGGGLFLVLFLALPFFIIHIQNAQRRKVIRAFVRQNAAEAVLVAARDIPAGTVVTPDMVKKVVVTRKTLRPDEFSAVDSVAGRTATAMIYKGERINKTAFEEQRGISYMTDQE